MNGCAERMVLEANLLIAGALKHAGMPHWGWHWAARHAEVSWNLMSKGRPHPPWVMRHGDAVQAPPGIPFGAAVLVQPNRASAEREPVGVFEGNRILGVFAGYVITVRGQVERAIPSVAPVRLGQNQGA